jgi:hypothetical protein
VALALAQTLPRSAPDVVAPASAAPATSAEPRDRRAERDASFSYLLDKASR